MPAWLTLASAVSVVIAFVTLRHGPARALGVAVGLSFAAPVWITVEWLGQPIGLRTATAIIALIVFTLHPAGRIRSPLTLLDFCIAAMFVAHVWSDTLATGAAAVTPIRAYGEWILPYIAGRFAIGNARDLRSLRPVMVSVAVVLAATSVIESVFQVNVWDVVFGTPPETENSREGIRFGLRRASGVADHPIFMAMLLLLMLPWARMSASRRAANTDQQQPVYRRHLPLLLVIAGVVAGVSRGPVLGLLIVATVVLLLNHRRLMLPALAVVTGLTAWCVIYPDAAVNILEKIVRSSVRLVEIDGTVQEITGTRSRLLIYEAYGGPMRNAGLTGYGTLATSQFPPNIPYLEASRDSVEKLRLVDNAYVLFILRFGWLGMTCFTVLFLTALGTVVQLRSDPQIKTWCTVFSGCLVATLLVFFTVWMSYDFGFCLLWSVGLVAGLASARQQRPRDEVAA